VEAFILGPAELPERNSRPTDFIMSATARFKGCLHPSGMLALAIFILSPLLNTVCRPMVRATSGQTFCTILRKVICKPSSATWSR